MPAESSFVHSPIRINIGVGNGTVTALLELWAEELIRGVCNLLCIH